MTEPSYLHPLEWQGEALPEAFTYPFRYTPHPLCVRAAAMVQEHLRETGVKEGKMYGVIVGRRPTPPVGHPSRNGGEAGAQLSSECEALPLSGERGEGLLRGDLDRKSVV